MGDPLADRERLVDAADLFAEKVDVLLDRVVDSLMGPARASSAEQLHADSTARVLTRIALAHLAGISPLLDVQRALREGLSWEQIGDAAGTDAAGARAQWSTEPLTESKADSRPRRRRSVDEHQMSMW